MFFPGRLIQEQHSENNQNLEPGEAKDSDIDNNNNNENSNINNIISNEIKAYNENNIVDLEYISVTLPDGFEYVTA